MRWEIINKIIEEHDIKSYLEIGVQKGVNFSQIDCSVKLGVDPDCSLWGVVPVDSDTFFAENRDVYELVFIDGLHHSDQVEKDIVNSWRQGAKYIVLHDCNPPDEISQTVPRATRAWWGDVWRAYVGFRMKHPKIETVCLDVDCGTAIIKCEGEIHDNFVTDMDWKDFDKNRKALLNLI